MKRRLVSIITSSILVAILAAGCGSSADGSGTQVASSSSSGQEQKKEAALGTRQNPVPWGTNVNVGPNWQVQVNDITPDAWSIIQAENMFNDPPAEGKQYVMARFKVSYVGKESGTPWVDLRLRYLGNDGNTYSGSCGVTPEELSDIGEQFPGASAEGNECWVVPASAVKGGAIIAEETFSFDDTRVFFAGVSQE